MEVVRQLSGFYKFIVALGMAAFSIFICVVLVFFVYCIICIVDYFIKKSEKNKKLITCMKIRIDNLEKEIMKRRKK